MLSMRSFIAVLLAALLLAAGGAEAKPKACKKFSAAGDQFVWDIVPLCMPNYSLTCTSSCRKHLKKVNLKCFSSLIKERMPWRLDGSVRFYKSCT
ncbi:hypothetical protein C2E20_3937 isoform B [Micractinium conductrix]|uniref:Prolamin-like domain-containing protein n=1 Tax=Micractinium conductrix TaxID=554055 RepID=A0A2P6VFI3_9CHLO|nr:hypothetical protein C2E20_3937 isoform A [Micractinium conductrix]PSC72856.1 hypothetical protein C2E20_3937 isoform B [Micractinium conductrix]|eukprot:PSC72855.1 hypothetical protein C2E20_3937 isoform A [Micractinium conductrix]